MAKYNWNFANVGGVTRVRIQSAEDIRHLGELDKKMWTVLSCPTTGLEISSDSLSLMDLDGDGKLRVKEVIATAEYLCGALKDPETLFEQKDELEVGNITEEAIKTVAEKLAKGGVVSLADVQAALREFSKELDDVDEMIDLSFNNADLLTFADYFMDGLFADFLMQGRINDAIGNVENTIDQVTAIRNALQQKLL